MEKTRKIKKVLISQPTLEGAGVHLHRGFGFREVPTLDPFLLFDDFRQDDPERYLPGFPWHPHRGIETITYMLRGTAEYGDSMGNRGVIGSGDVQWMTAGSGIVHQEMPKGGEDGRMGGLPTLGQPARVPEDDGPALPRREADGHARGRPPRRRHRPRHLRDGRKDPRAGPGHRHRP